MLYKGRAACLITLTGHRTVAQKVQALISFFDISRNCKKCLQSLPTTGWGRCTQRVRLTSRLLALLPLLNPRVRLFAGLSGRLLFDWLLL